MLKNHLLPAFGKRRLNSIQPVQIRSWIADLVADGLAADTVRKAHQLLADAREHCSGRAWYLKTQCFGWAQVFYLAVWCVLGLVEVDYWILLSWSVRRTNGTEGLSAGVPASGGGAG